MWMDVFFVVYQINSFLSASGICNLNAYVSVLPLIKEHVTTVAECNLHFTTIKPGTIWEGKRWSWKHTYLFSKKQKDKINCCKTQISCSSTANTYTYIYTNCFGIQLIQNIKKWIDNVARGAWKAERAKGRAGSRRAGKQLAGECRVEVRRLSNAPSWRVPWSVRCGTLLFDTGFNERVLADPLIATIQSKDSLHHAVSDYTNS